MDFGWSGGITTCNGVELNILADGTFAIRIVNISLQSKLVQIVSKEDYRVSLDKISTIKLRGLVALTINGKGVLIRKTARMETVTEQSIRQLFPGFNPDEFYLQHFQSADNSFIAFVRKQIADPIISAIKKQGAEVLILSLGPFVADHIIPQLNNYGSTLIFDGHQLSLNEEKAWLDYAYEPGAVSEFELKIDIEPIADHFLLAYAAAFQLLLSERLDLIAVQSEEISQDLLEVIAKLKFSQRGKIILMSFFALLLINFLLFSYYNDLNQELAGKVGQRSDLYTDRQKLETEVKEKEVQVKLIGWNHGLPFAYLCDRIGQTVPAPVTLHEISVGRIKDQAGNTTEKAEMSEVNVTGQSANVYLIHDWIYALRQQPWVKVVRLEKYTRDDQQDAQVFTLMIKY